jgi:putative ABC transport system permease protein
LIAAFPGGLPRAESISVDGWATGFAVAMTVAVGLGLGLASAVASSKVKLDEALQAGSRNLGGGRGALRARSALVVAQVGLGLALSLTAAWLIQSYSGLRRVQLGFDPRQVTSFTLNLPAGTVADESRVRATVLALIERIEAIPGVTGAAAISDLPLESPGPGNDFRIENRADPGPSRGHNAHQLTVTPGIFEVLRIPLVRGRLLAPGDDAASPLVAVINETTARRYFPNQDPLGQRIRYMGDTDPWLTIVGVVGDVRSDQPGAPPGPSVYLSHSQPTRNLPILRSLSFVIRTPASPASIGAELRAAISAAAPVVPMAQLRSLSDVVDIAMGPTTFAMALITTFAAVVLLLAALGMYGLLAHSIVIREREIGLRMALGATRAVVWSEVLAQGIRLAVVGIAIGLGIALAASPLLADLLFEVRVTNPWVILAAAGILLLMAGIACGIPAFRAARTPPMDSLRA